MSATIIDPPNTLPRIAAIWAYVSVDARGNEGLCAASMPNGMMMPLIAADQDRLASITKIAERLAARTGIKIVLVEFTERRELREITGRAS